MQPTPKLGELCPSFPPFRAALGSFANPPHHSLALLVNEVDRSLGREFVERFAVFRARQSILSTEFKRAPGSLDWLYEVHERVQCVAPTLSSIDATCRARSLARLLDQVRYELLTTSAKQGTFTHRCSSRERFKEITRLRFPRTRLGLARVALSAFGSRVDSTHVNLASNLAALGWIVEMEAYLIDALCSAIRDHVQKSCSGVFDQELLGTMLSWMDQVAFPWLNTLILPQALENTRSRVEFFVHETFGSLRISELFDIVTMFPESAPALCDLKICLARTHQHRELISSFGQALERRLLHPGANTNSILIVYVRAIKAMRLLDPRGVLLEAVQDPVRLYLQSRPETVRCVVTALTNDGTNSELFAELGLDSTEVKPLDFENDEAADESQDALAEWEPDPIEADPGSTSKSRSTNDILSMLVRIYGSVQVFVNEYRTLLADRLLKTPDFDVDSELKSLELLKLRFGEAAMHVCGLMIKDVADSRRINANIKVDFPLEAVIVSRISWPGFSAESFSLHPMVKKAVKAYTKRFSELKKLRRIKWRHHVGVVELNVSVQGSESRSYSVAPVLANLLAHLIDRPEWTLPQLAEVCGLDEELTRKKMAFWVSEGVAVETKRGGYTAATVLERQTGQTSAADVDEEEMDQEIDHHEKGGFPDSDGGDSTARDQTHAQFIAHMLTNLGALPIEGIHRNLQMFSPAMGAHSYDRSEQELHSFLQLLVGRGAIEMNGEGTFQVGSGG